VCRRIRNHGGGQKRKGVREKRERKKWKKKGNLDSSPFDFSRTTIHHDGEAFRPGPLDSVGPFKRFLLVAPGATHVSEAQVNEYY
jgi:hypothetical protein